MKSIVLLSLLGVTSMFAGVFNYRKLILPIILIGLAAAIGLLADQWGTNKVFFEMALFDNYAIAFSCLLISVAFLIFTLALYHYRNESDIVTDLYALFLFALTGGVLMTSFNNLVMLFLGIEILSIPLYVLAGSRRADLASNEAALKYFLMGAFATGFLLFGIALVYGASGTFDMAGIAAYVQNSKEIPDFFYIGIVLLIVALLFKVSAAPFHFWAPDVYQGSPVLVTTFMSTVVKIAAFAAFLRLFNYCFTPLSGYYDIILIAAAIATLLIGNITALYQQSVKRMLAYSGISHAGYLLIALVVMGASATSVVFFYSAAYAAASLIAFSVLTAVMENKEGRESFESFKGLAKNNPLLALCMSIAMLSLAGIPPLAGFFGKYFLFATAIKDGFLWLVFVAIFNSLVSLYYYLRVIVNMYTTSDEETPAFKPNYALVVMLLITVGVSLALGFYPDLLMGLL
ncbi:MAG: NADH-quinone oxidoreductase subunit N [Sphingobacteriales bacterium JAD_PAG50586_3]|nr:MAG: NADH-quinone oxidoreductase subunit N [Sphingobacteriales bacterium JAD_PAG50586_3]